MAFLVCGERLRDIWRVVGRGGEVSEFRGFARLETNRPRT